jgi:hypothetical protein
MHRNSRYQIVLAIFRLMETKDPGFAMDSLFDIALDVAGVPVDNTLETGACDFANSMPEDGWPHWGFCRDSIMEELMEHSGFPERQAAIAMSHGAHDWARENREIPKSITP